MLLLKALTAMLITHTAVLAQGEEDMRCAIDLCQGLQGWYSFKDLSSFQIDVEISGFHEIPPEVEQTSIRFYLSHPVLRVTNLSGTKYL